MQQFCLDIGIRHKLPVLRSIKFRLAFHGMDTRLFVVLGQQLLIVNINVYVYMRCIFKLCLANT